MTVGLNRYRSGKQAPTRFASMLQAVNGYDEAIAVKRQGAAAGVRIYFHFTDSRIAGLADIVRAAFPDECA